MIDDIGMLPVAPDAAEALFRVVDAAYEKRSIALTSNIHPAGFDELMPKTLAAATVDRLLHHAHVLLTDGTDSLPARPSDRRQGGDAPDLTRASALDRRSDLALRARLRDDAPVVGTSDGRQRGENMAASGENRWPPLGRNRWPLTNLADVRRAAVHACPDGSGRLRRRYFVVGAEAMRKACGVLVARL